MIKFPCHCGYIFTLEDDMAGSLIQCPRCRRLTDIPTLDDLGHLDDDGTIKMEDPEVRDEPDRYAQLERTFFKGTVDREGNEIDLRPTMEDIRRAGKEEIPLELQDQMRPGSPKYDPFTGELIRPLDVRPDEPGKPVAAESATLGYARRSVVQVLPPKSPALALLRLPNLVVLGTIFLFHLFGLLMLSAYGAGQFGFLVFFLLLPVSLFLFIAVVSHYANVIDEMGPEDRDELPLPLRSLEWHEDLGGPFIQICTALGVCYGPAVAVLVYLPGEEVAWALSAALALAGSLIFPAVLLTTATSGSVLNLRPDRVAGVIRLCGFRYLAVTIGWLIVLVFYVGGMAAAGRYAWAVIGRLSDEVTLPPVVGHPAVAAFVLFVGIYGVHLFCWHLGLLYRLHQPEFPWVLQGKPRSEAPTPRRGFAVEPPRPPKVATADRVRPHQNPIEPRD